MDTSLRIFGFPIFGVVMKTPPLAALAAVSLALIVVSSPVSAQTAGRSDADDEARPVLSRSSSGSESQAFPSAAELRQARALYRSRQRLERIERNAWLGHDPLRPTVSAVPMMTSRYGARRVIYVPMFPAPGRW